MSVEDSLMVRNIMRDVGRHPLDISDLRVNVSAGVVYLAGSLKPLRGYHDDADVDEILNTLLKSIRQRPGVRDIIVDLQTPSKDRRKERSERRRRVAL